MVLGSFLNAVAQILHIVLTLYIWVVIIAAVCSLVQANPYNKIVQVLYSITEPLYAQIRRIVAHRFRWNRFCSIYCYYFVKIY